MTGWTWYPIECEHGYDHCPICDAVESNPMGKPPFIQGQWMRSEWDGKVKRHMELFNIPPRSMATRRLGVSVHLNETKLEGTDDMRLVFNTSMTVDVSANDDELRKAFIDLVCLKAREVYGPAAMLAKGRPIMKVTETSRDGMRDLDMFTGMTLTADEMDSD